MYENKYYTFLYNTHVRVCIYISIYINKLVGGLSNTLCKVGQLSCMQSDLKIPSGQHLYKGEQLNFKPYACDLKINSEHLLSRGIHLAKFGNFEAKGPKDIKRTGMLSLFYFIQSNDKNIPPWQTNI